MDGDSVREAVELHVLGQPFNVARLGFEGVDVSARTNLPCEMAGLESDIGADVQDYVAWSDVLSEQGEFIPLKEAEEDGALEVILEI